MSKRLRAAFDCDGVILNADEIFRDHFECQGFKVIENGKFNYSLDPDPGAQDIANMIDDCLDRRTVDMDTYEGVEDLFHRLADVTDSQPVTVVTAREQMFATQTVSALSRVFHKNPFVTAFTGGFGKMNHLKDFHVFVEDRRKTAVNLARSGKVVICPKHPWNWPIGLPQFEVGRPWTWIEEHDLKEFGLGYRGQPPDLFWMGRIVFVESMESLLKNESVFALLVK